MQGRGWLQWRRKGNLSLLPSAELCSQKEKGDSDVVPFPLPIAASLLEWLLLNVCVTDLGIILLWSEVAA